MNAPLVRSRAVLANYATLFPYCQACGLDAYAARTERWPGLELHHIVLGHGRSDEPCNLLSLCNVCHRLTHHLTIRDERGAILPDLGLPVYLRIKMVRDLDGWQPERLEELRACTLPDLVDLLPKAIEDQFRANRPRDVYRFDLAPWESYRDFGLLPPKRFLFGRPVVSNPQVIDIGLDFEDLRDVGPPCP